jgi:hypothetical protein
MLDLGLLIPISAATGGGIFFLARLGQRASTWRHTARCAALTSVRETRTLGALVKLQAEANGFGVTFTGYRRGRYERGTRIVVDGRRQIPAALGLRAEGVATTLDRAMGGKELEVGDSGFDAEVYAQGPEELLLALLDRQTRAEVRALLSHRGRVTEGTVRLEVPTWVNANMLSGALDAALRAARRLRQPDDIVDRLVTSVHDDHVAGFRLRCLDLLARRFADDARARKAFRAALDFADDELRLCAAAALGEEGLRTLRALASDVDTAEPLAVRALSALGANLPAQDAVAILDSALRAGRTAVALAATQALGRTPGVLALSRLETALASDSNELAVTAARALAATADTRAEPPLIAALASPRAEVRTAAAEALARSGTVAAVAPLHAAIEAHLLDLGLRSAARQAIAAIQERVPGASPGQVALADADAGHVSLASRAEGDVSLTPEDEAAH